MNTKKNSISSVVFAIFAAVFFVLAGFFLYKGYDKMTNYNHSDSYYSENVNAYVGGDAYNLIINGTYTTSFFVLSAAGIIAGTMCACTSALLSSSGKEIATQQQSMRQQAIGGDVSGQLPEL